MSKKIVVLLSVFLVAAIFVVGVIAQGSLPGGGWWSGEQIQNVGNGPATINVTAYDSSSGATYAANSTLDAAKAITFVPSSFASMPDGFQGSAVVSSDQPVKAVVNVTNRASGSLGISGGMAAAQYQGVDGNAVAETLYFPLVKGDSYNKTTTFYIQNTGNTATTATATFTMRNNDVHTYVTPSIGPNQMVVFSVMDAASFNPSDNNGRVGGLVVQSNTSGVTLAGVVMEHYTSENPATIAQATRGFTSVDFDTKAYAPVIKNDRFGRFTGIQVQNVSGGSIDVTVDYIGTAGDCAGNTYQDATTGVVVGTSYTFVQSGASNLPANCTASATISATGNIVAIVNESYTSSYLSSNPGKSQRSTTYSALPDAMATSQIRIPLFKDDRYNKRTGLQIQNVSGAQITDLVATFECSGGSTFTAVSAPQTVANGAGFLFYTPSQQSVFESATPFASNGVNCSVTVTAGGNIVAIANESVDTTGTLEQDNNNYEGFNVN